MNGRSAVSPSVNGMTATPSALSYPLACPATRINTVHHPEISLFSCLHTHCIPTAMILQQPPEKNGLTSTVHLIPPEIFKIIGSHLDKKSFITTSHVCHFWRSALFSSPPLWSHLTLKVDERTSEGPKSVPIFVDLDLNLGLSESVGQSLKERATSLQVAVNVRSFEESLVRLFPSEGTLPPVRFLAGAGANRLRLTNLHLQLYEVDSESKFIPMIGDILLDLLKLCPLLEVVFFDYGSLDGDIGFTTEEGSKEATVSLPRLRSFTHQSPGCTIGLGLFNRLSLPLTCEVAFTIKDLTWTGGRWGCGFPVLHDPSYLAKCIEIVIYTRDDGLAVVQTTFLNSENKTISFNWLTPATRESSSPAGVIRILEFLGNCPMAKSVEILHFENLPYALWPSGPDLTIPLFKLPSLNSLELCECNPEPFLRNPDPPSVWCRHVKNLMIFLPLTIDPLELLELVRDIAVSRRNHGIPLETVFLSFREVEDSWSQASQDLIEELEEQVEFKIF